MNAMLVTRIRRLAAAVAMGMTLAVATVASSAQADAPIPASFHLTYADCATKGDAGLNFTWVGYYCTTDFYDPKFIVLMVYYPE